MARTRFRELNLGWRNLRDFLTWAAGIALIFQQVFTTGTIAVPLIPVVGGLLGLPFVFRAEDRPRDDRG